MSALVTAPPLLLWTLWTLWTLCGHRGPVLAACFSPDGRIIASCDDGSVTSLQQDESLDDVTAGAVILWDSATGEIQQRLQLPPSPTGACGGYSCAFSHAASGGGGKRHVLAVGCVGLIVVFASSSSSPSGGGREATTAFSWSDARIFSGVHSNAVLSLAFSPCGSSLLAGGWDGFASVWCVQTGRLLRAVQAHAARIRCIAWSGAGDWIATASDDATVRVWKGSSLEGGLVRLAGHFDWVRLPPGAISHLRSLMMRIPLATVTCKKAWRQH